MEGQDLTEVQQQFVERFALAWETIAYGRMEGRVMGLFMIVDRPYLASSEIAKMLSASAGAVSMATRKLIMAGFIHRHMVPGAREHHFAAEEDVWGGFLKSERGYLRQLTAVINTADEALQGEAVGPRRRISHAQNYLTWIDQQHAKLLADWNAYRDAHDPEKPHG